MTTPQDNKPQEYFIPISIGEGSDEDENPRDVQGSQSARSAQSQSEGSRSSCWAPLDTAIEEQEDRSSTPTNIYTETTLPVEPKTEHEKTMQDRLVSGSLGLMKLAGGITLSTTGKLIMPPLKITKEIIIPALWEATKDRVSFYTPQRLKDWFQIVFASLYNCVNVLKNTPKGKIFRSKIEVVGSDIVDCLTSDASRQCIADGMGTLVKLSEALHTPEFKSFLSQLNVLGARLVDVAASGRNKQLFNDMEETAWSFIELSSDPQTIVALAEVTATLCHTLEMEDAVYRRKSAPETRYQRNEYTNKAYNIRELIKDPNVTNEQAIMSGLGGVPELVGGPPNNGVAGSTASANSAGDTKKSNETNQTSTVDSFFLEKKVQERANEINRRLVYRNSFREKKQKEDSRNEIEDLVVETVEENEVERDDNTQADTSKDECKQRAGDTTKRPLVYEDRKSDSIDGQFLNVDKTDVESESLEAPSSEISSALSQFYATMDKVMAERRSESLRGCLADYEQVKSLSKKGIVRSKPSDTSKIKNIMNDLKDVTKDVDSDAISNIIGAKKKRSDSATKVLMLFYTIFAFVAIVWFGFGCYGMVVFFKTTIGNNGSIPAMAASSQNVEKQEIVIRVVREVIHKSDQSHIDSRSNNLLIKDQEEAFNEKEVVDCVAKVLK